MKKNSKNKIITPVDINTILSSSQLAIFLINNQGMITYCNGNVLNLILRKPETLIGSHATDTLGDIFNNDLEQALNGKEFISIVKTPLGRVFEKRYSVISYEDGKQAGSVCIVTDTTLEHKIQEDLEINFNKYSTLFEQIETPLIEFNISELVNYVNSLKNNGNIDLNKYILEFPEELYTCFSYMKVIDLNNAAIRLIEAEDRQEAKNNFPRLFTDDTINDLKSSIFSIFKNKLKTDFETSIITLKGKKVIISGMFYYINDNKGTIARVIISVRKVLLTKSVQPE